VTREEYYRLCEEGWFDGRHVQLIGGEIVEMAAQKNFRRAAIDLTRDALVLAFGPGYWIRAQGTLDLSPLSCPDPDIAVVPGSPRGCSQKNPTSALLVAEVSDTTLAYDRGPKASLYAASGIADYWIVNLVDRRLEVHRDPVPDPAEPFGHRYQNVTHLLPTDTVTPLAAPQASLAVADLLP
jgi:Uma2 family endonuclease